MGWSASGVPAGCGFDLRHCVGADLRRTRDEIRRRAADELQMSVYNSSCGCCQRLKHFDEAEAKALLMGRRTVQAPAAEMNVRPCVRALPEVFASVQHFGRAGSDFSHRARGVIARVRRYGGNAKAW
jgi:hypothetical protein